LAGSAVPRDARFILAEKLESCIAAHSAAAAGRLPEELTMELTIPSAADTSLAPLGQHIASVLVRPVPLAADKAQLETKIIAALNRVAPGLSAQIAARDVSAPADISSRFGVDTDNSDVARLAARWNERLATPVRGLTILEDPVTAISGRAGRIAASLAAKEIGK
jgi:phytoene dehydrogenase-like protein